MDKSKSLLPWYINRTLSEKEREAVELWLQRDSNAKTHHQEIQQLTQIILGQEEKTPPDRVRTRLLLQVGEQPIHPKASTHPWVWGTPVMLLIFVLLWFIIQPGTQLRWSTSGSIPAAFRIYRAPAGSQDFTLIEELPASPTQHTYQYADYLIVPGQNYQYVIEVRDQSGYSTISQIATNGWMMIFASQIAILLSSFMLTFGMITIAEEIKPKSQLKLAT